MDISSSTSQAYFAYLRRRSKLSFWIRQQFFHSLTRYFSGRVLDIGCGLGEFLAVYPGEGYGIDINPYCVQWCQARGYRCLEGTIDQIPFPDAFFDGVLLSHVLEHLDRPEDALREVRRVLRPGGVLCVAVPLEAGFKKDATHVRFFDREALNQLLSQCRFQVKRAWFYPLPASWAGKWLYFNELRVLATKQ